MCRDADRVLPYLFFRRADMQTCVDRVTDVRWAFGSIRDRSLDSADSRGAALCTARSWPRVSRLPSKRVARPFRSAVSIASRVK